MRLFVEWTAPRSCGGVIETPQLCEAAAGTSREQEVTALLARLEAGEPLTGDREKLAEAITDHTGPLTPMEDTARWPPPPDREVTPVQRGGG
jgi:hypothetical protein